jgi:hypothetical protein
MAVNPAARSSRASQFPRLKLGLLSIGLLLAFILAGENPARAEERRNDWSSTAPRLFKVCKDQTYALCAVADCTVFNGVSYCKCDVMSGDSISLPFNYDDGQDICSVNTEGKDNGYMASTYSLPKSVVAPEGDQALYNCPAATSTGAYAQCDGGLCFTSTEGQSFPGFDKPLKKGELICSCPITVANPETAKTGYQIAGPYPCEASYFQNCNSETANTDTGATIHVGSPTGVARLLTRRLDGQVPPLHECRPD